MDFKQLANQLLSSASYLLVDWLPGGALYGAEYTCGSLQGGVGRSCKVNVHTGKWADFSTNEKGGDLISLYAAIHGITQKESARRLADKSSVFEKRDLSKPQSTPKKQPLKKIKTLVPVPHGTNLPSLEHYKHGLPSGTWTYQNADGLILFIIARYDTPHGKEIIPWSFDGHTFVPKAHPENRPLYNLPEILANPEKPILIVEGEKSAEAARTLDMYVVTTWSGGSRAFNKTDWTPLNGRRILIWPDADQPGRDAAIGLLNLLKPHAKTIKAIDVQDKPEGWDAADCFPFWTKAEWTAWAKPLLMQPDEFMQHKIEVAHQESHVPLDPLPDEMPPMPTEIDATYEVLEPEPSSPEIRIDMGELAIPQAIRGELTNAGMRFTVTGQPIVNLFSIKAILSNLPETKGTIWEDSFHNQLFIIDEGKSRPWVDDDLFKIQEILQGKYCLHRLTKQTLEDAISRYAASHARREPQDWLATLKWDGNQRIENFMAECMDAEPSQYTFAVSKNFWISLVARIKKPGCKVDNMVVFEGPQGSMKSSALQAIGGKWFGELNERPDSKDFVLALTGKILLEIAELDSFRRAESTTIKRIITTQTDRIRKPYGKTMVEMPRACIFAGSTNEVDYLQDQTGGRRFWPIKCGKIDLDKIKNFREQCFAEASYLYDQGEKWYVVPDSAKEEQELRTQDDSWMDLVAPFVYGKPEIKLIDVLTQALEFNASHIKRYDEVRAGTLLKKLGYSKKKLRRSGIQQKLWAKELSDEEKNATPVSHQPMIPTYLD
jgi:putative DNA primase/helicase